ncbi:MAG: hypothetical protein ACRDSJ_09630 [Rubrobacteraceae bacterium]
MGERGNGEGSIYRRKDGRWVGQYLIHTSKGPKYRYIYGKTRQAVSERLSRRRWPTATAASSSTQAP